jgi:hypothetical protein
MHEFWNALDLLEDEFNRMPKEMQNSPTVILTFTIGAFALLLFLRENEGKNTKFLLEVFLALIMTERKGRHALFSLPGDKVHHNQQDSKRQYIKAIAAAVLERAFTDEGGKQASWGQGYSLRSWQSRLLWQRWPLFRRCRYQMAF